MVDLAEIAQLDGLERIVCPAQKCPHNPILPLGEVDQHDSVQARSWCGSLIHDPRDRLFKMWYTCADHDPKTSGTYNQAYAFSYDGINWHKPELGLREYRGSRRNNLILLGESDNLSLEGSIQNWSSDDPDRRFAMWGMRARGGDGRHAHYLFFSADGLNWTQGPRLPDFDWHSEFMLDVSSVLFDPAEPDPQRRFKAYGQGFWPSPHFSQKLAHVPLDTPADHLPIDWLDRISEIHRRGKDGHHIVRVARAAFSPDGVSWKKRLEPVLDPNDGREAEIHYCVVLRHAGQYFMVYEYAIFEPLFNKYYGDLRLAHSRDGEHFTRINPTQPLVARGQHGQWDDGFLVNSDQLIVHDDKIWIYYSGCGEDWNHWPRGTAPAWAGASRGSIYKSQQGLATLGLERFTALATCDGLTPGTARTTPIDVIDSANASLWVNTSGGSSVRSWTTVEVLDAQTLRPLEGFTQYDCDRILADGLRNQVTWKGDATFNGIAASTRRIALRFCLHGGARLHAFGFSRRD
jgi:hypothetical protein